MIGMALGSPSHPPFVQSNVPEQLQTPAAHTGAHTHSEGVVDAKSTNAKGGRWKKFGGLFRPKHTPSIQAAQTTSQLSHQQHHGQNTDAVEPSPPSPPKDIPRLGQTLGRSLPLSKEIPQLGQTWGQSVPLSKEIPQLGETLGHSVPLSKEIPQLGQTLAHSVPTKDNPQLDQPSVHSVPLPKDIPQPVQTPHSVTLPQDIPQLGQKSGHSVSESIESALSEDVEDSGVSLLRTELPKLDVEIPSVHMDRYSVMFGSLLRGRQSVNLLSRRSKVLDKLKTDSNEDLASQDPLPQQEQPDNVATLPDPARLEDHERLNPQASSRRATSPATGRSPNFSLFPQPPTTPRRAAAMTSQSAPGPLQRSFTAPSRLSLMDETADTPKPQVVKPNHIKRRKSSISLVETSASTTQGPSWSTDGSYLSPNSSVSSVGDEILFDIKKLSMVTENHEPQYEVTKPDGETLELYRALSQKIKASKPPALKLHSKNAKEEATKPPSPIPDDSVVSRSDATAQLAGADTNNTSTVPKSLSTEYLLPSTHYIPNPPVVEAAKEQSTPGPNRTTLQASKPPAEVKERSLPAPSRTMARNIDLLAEIEESAEASQEILAAAVMGTLDYMEEQSSVRAASPMPESPGLRTPTPEKPVKLLVIPKHVPTSKYSLRSPTASHFKSDAGIRPASPQFRRAVTEPHMHDESLAAHATTQQAAPDTPNSRLKKATIKSNSSSKIVPPQSKGNNKMRESPPELSIVAPEPADAIDIPNGASSPVEVTVAREVPLARKKSKRLLIPPAGRKIAEFGTDNGEKVVNTQALMPVIVDANKAHRPGKSLALVIENA